MEFKQHLKGVIIAIFSATILLFVISFFVGHEVRVNKSFVFQEESDSLYNFMKDPKNFKNLVSGTDEVEISFLKKGIGVQYEGFDKSLHTFKYQVFDKSLGLELLYIKEEEEQAIFKYRLNPKKSGTLLEFEKVWKISLNPLTKLLSIGVDEDIEAGMKLDMKKLKQAIQK